MLRESMLIHFETGSVCNFFLLTHRSRMANYMIFFFFLFIFCDNMKEERRKFQFRSTSLVDGTTMMLALFVLQKCFWTLALQTQKLDFFLLSLWDQQIKLTTNSRPHQKISMHERNDCVCVYVWTMMEEITNEAKKKKKFNISILFFSLSLCRFLTFFLQFISVLKSAFNFSLCGCLLREYHFFFRLHHSLAQ